MTVYYLDSRATGANDGDPDADTGPDENGIYQDAWQSIDDAEAGAPLSGPHTLHFVEGSGPYTLTGACDGIGNSYTIEGNGCIIDGSIDLNGAAYKWTQSAANPLEYYIEAAAGGDPSISTVTCGTIAGKFQEASAEESTYQLGTVGSLADGFMGYGDNDTLGYSTVYARYDSAALDSIEVRVSQQTHIWDSNFTNPTINDLVMQYASTSNIRLRAGSGTATLSRCVFKFCSSATGGNAVEVSAANDTVINHCISYFAGHRAYNASAATSGDITVNGCVDVKGHIFAIVHASYAGTLTIRNCIGYLAPAGVIDTAANATFTFVENNNCWYPTLSSETSLEYPDGADNIWTTTAATDFPPSADTGIASFVALVTAGAVDPLFVHVDLLDYSACNFALQDASPIKAAGAKYWTGAPPIGADGEPFPSWDISIGAIQSKAVPFHPTQL